MAGYNRRKKEYTRIVLNENFNAEEQVVIGISESTTKYHLKAGDLEAAKKCALTAYIECQIWAEKSKDKVGPEVIKNYLERAEQLLKEVGLIDAGLKLPKDINESYKTVADILIAKKQYVNAITCFKNAGCSLSTLPKTTLEKLLGLAREGNVRLIQGLAGLVQTEEDEILFNEARAGMVL